MIFALHDEISMGGDPPVTRRVVRLSRSSNLLWVLDTGTAGSWPERMDLAEATENVRAGYWTVAEGHVPSHPLDTELPSSQVAKRRVDYEVIEHIAALADGDELFDRLPRAKFVRSAMTAFDLSRPTVTRILLAWFHGGMTPGALVPGWSRCGAPGKAREVRAESPKRGRPVRAGHLEGTNVTAEMTKAIILAWNTSYVRNRKCTKVDAYRWFLKRFCFDEILDESGRSKHRPKAAFENTGIPTFRQFEYWTNKCCRLEDARRARMTARVYELKHRALLGTSTSEAEGPGTRFQIDATVLDIYLVSRTDAAEIVGRPTLYLVVDVFSRMIVGIYIGLENASWLAAMSALANAASDKVEYCRSIGIDITPDEWPVACIPGIVLGDKGEILKSGIEGILAVFNISVENASAYRPDWKGIVEQRFYIVPAMYKAYAPGYVEVDYGQRGARDYRLDATLNVDDLTKIIVECVLVHNNSNELTGYPRMAAMTRDSVPSVPRDLWNWGVTNVSGRPRRPPLERFCFALLPRDEASVTREGIVYQGRYYSCPRFHAENWAQKAQRRRFKVKVSFDKRNAGVLFVHAPNAAGFEVAALTERSRAFEGISFWEAEAMVRKDARASAVSRSRREAGRADATTAFEAVVEEAGLRKQLGVGKPDVRNIRANRARDADVHRVDDSRRFLPATAPGKVVVSPPGTAAAVSGTGAPSFARVPTSQLRKKWEKPDA